MRTGCYEVHSENDKILFLVFILGIDDEVYNKGKEFIIKNNKSFEILWNMFSKINDFSIIIEDFYIDRVYRDSYYFYYSCKHFEYSRYCKRFFLFEGFFDRGFIDFSEEDLNNRFIGSFVIRPLQNRAIGRSLLNPKYFVDDNSYIRVTKYGLTMFGKRLNVDAFPYSMQDGETTSCAEITILNLLDYYSQTYPEYRYILPSDICRIAEEYSYDRRLPTTGLRYELITKIFSEVGFYPRLYSSDKIKNYKFKNILHYYIESGIPIALGIKLNSENRHSIIVVGHGKLETKTLGSILYSVIIKDENEVMWICDSADIVNDYYVMDDNKEPYKLYNLESGISVDKAEKDEKITLNGFKLEYIMVPLYKRMFMEAADAHAICTNLLASKELGIRNAIPEIGSKDYPITIRLFMASARNFKNIRLNQFSNVNLETRNIYAETIFPKFIWICELYKLDSYPNKVIGEIIIDATSSADTKFDSVITIHYPNIVSIRKPDTIKNNSDVQFRRVKQWEEFEPYYGNLKPFNM